MESTINWKKDTLGDVNGNNIYWHEVEKYKQWDNGLLVRIKKENQEFDTISLRAIITGKDTTTEFRDQNNQIINYLTFKNKVILLDFWFLACKPCIAELPGLGLLNKKINSDQFEVITFANDSLEELEFKILSKRKLNFKIIPNTYIIGSSYPYKVLISKKHQFVDSKNTANLDSQIAIKQLLDRYIPLIKKELKK